MVSMLPTDGLMPHLFFHDESVEDRNASMAAGRLVSKSVHRVTIRQPGSKDDVTKDVDIWFPTLSQNKDWRPEWIERAKAMYAQFKEGQEPTQVGTHVRTWPAVNKAEAETLIAAGIRTVEELALANEQMIGRVGVGGRALKQKAQAWLDSAAKDGRAAEELNELRQKNETQAAQIAELMQKMNELIAAKAAPAPEPPKTDDKPAEAKDDFLG